MNKSTIMLLGLFLLCVLSCGRNDTKSNDQNEEEVLLLALQKFNTAFADGDVTTLSSMITDKYLHTNATSKAIQKENWLSYLQKREVEITSGLIETLNYEMDEVALTFYGDAALVTARIKTEVRKNDSISTSQYRVTHLWVKENGQWKRAGFHDTRID
ncbi:nuclear transport factor 2 family protein [Flagellimonas allohymeniacidonis]|uniref:Nuclear transport factor 2 family protein n=1 Tax=Flagellimonas allohymeniacidonis TaxID=2517819 RepID=A0A4Q8QLL2_9FLAO|nr:nuclear transport factor 2 family protein [Allomuricauda hymeniacidonis]TAI49156.1 nuclear transport factor 2 family protein [Allomuricauda hymeniacidonis]